jgi:hypothetical protein
MLNMLLIKLILHLHRVQRVRVLGLVTLRPLSTLTVLCIGASETLTSQLYPKFCKWYVYMLPRRDSMGNCIYRTL